MSRMFNSVLMAAIALILTSSIACATRKVGPPVYHSHDYRFHQSKMLIKGDDIYLVSSFKKRDIISKYDFNGQRKWSVPFHAKVLAWDVTPRGVVVFSKGRAGRSTYLTLLGLKRGKVIWERP